MKSQMVIFCLLLNSCIISNLPKKIKAINGYTISINSMQLWLPEYGIVNTYINSNKSTDTLILNNVVYQYTNNKYLFNHIIMEVDDSMIINDVWDRSDTINAKTSSKDALSIFKKSVSTVWTYKEDYGIEIKEIYIAISNVEPIQFLVLRYENEVLKSVSSRAQFDLNIQELND